MENGKLRIENEFSEMARWREARWRDGEMARREERDSEIDIFTKRKSGLLNKEKKRKREKRGF